MAEKGKPSTLRWVVAVLAGVIAVGFLVQWMQSGGTSGVPRLATPDLDGNRQAGLVELWSGGVKTRLALPEDFSPGRRSVASADSPGTIWTPITQARIPYFLGSLFRLEQKSMVQLTSSGNYLVILDGPGEFVLEDAKRDDAPSRRVFEWVVHQGGLRAKPNEYEASEQWLVVRTPAVRIEAKESEIGLSVGENGQGKFWLVSGQARLFKKDGSERLIEQRGVYDL